MKNPCLRIPLRNIGGGWIVDDKVILAIKSLKINESARSWFSIKSNRRIQRALTKYRRFSKYFT